MALDLDCMSWVLFVLVYCSCTRPDTGKSTAAFMIEATSNKNVKLFLGSTDWIVRSCSMPLLTSYIVFDSCMPWRQRAFQEQFCTLVGRRWLL